MGSAAGLQRTAQYLGDITASGLIGLLYGERASDSGLHAIALIGVVLGLLLLALTLADRSLRAGATGPGPRLKPAMSPPGHTGHRDHTRPTDKGPQHPDPAPGPAPHLCLTSPHKEHPCPPPPSTPRTALILIDLQKGIAGLPCARCPRPRSSSAARGWPPRSVRAGCRSSW